MQVYGSEVFFVVVIFIVRSRSPDEERIARGADLKVESYSWERVRVQELPQQVVSIAF